MARTYRNLWPQLVSWENLVVAYQKCRRRKRYLRQATCFDYAWEANLLQLQRELASGIYEPGSYRHFYIYEPKRRKISAAPFRDRVVHHALVKTLEPLYERRFIHDSYACRKGKGTHRAIHRAMHYLRRHKYCLKTDVVRFFPNVDHEVLIQLLTKSIRDEQVMWLVKTIVGSGEAVLAKEATQLYFPGDDLFSVLRPKGLPIGNLTSQFLANVLLDPVDHFVKEELRVPGYVRYADDLILFGDDKRRLWDIYAALNERLAAIRLKFHPNKTVIRPSATGIKFLGFVIKPTEIRVQQAGLKRFNRRLRYLKWACRNRLIDARAVTASLTAWVAHAQHANSSGIRQEVWRRVKFQRAARI